VGPRISIFSRGSDAISPTAHYTGRVWLRNGLSDPAFATWEGQVLYAATAPLLAAAKLAGAPTLEAFLLARHHLIDEILTEGIEDGSISQIVEIAAGLSPRGLRFTREHPDITYVEADLPGMAERKRAALAAAGTPLRVADLDALAPSGAGSIAELAASLDADRGTAFVTEGLLNYFPREEVIGVWGRIATALGRFPTGLYVSDLHLQEGNDGVIERAFSLALGGFVRGSIYFPLADEQDALEQLEAAGFASAELHSGTEASDDPGAERVHVVEARMGSGTL
jgi:O-methyltransferase involved in polyketide biosynthesis